MNDAQSTLSVIGWSLSVGSGADIESLSGPFGWDMSYDVSSNVVDWASPDVPYDISPGVQATFSFLSPLDSSPQAYAVAGLDETTFDSDIAQGQIASPSQPTQAVPEPSAGVAFLILAGCYALGCRIARRAGAPD